MSVEFNPAFRTNQSDGLNALGNDLKGKGLPSGPDPEFLAMLERVRKTDPVLTTPMIPVTEMDFSAFPSVPSPGADLLALLSEVADEQRRANNDARSALLQSTVSELEGQASRIRTQAAVNLASGLISAGFEFAQGAYSSIASGAALKSVKGLDSTAQAALLQIKGTKIQGNAAAFKAVGDAIKSVMDYEGTIYDVENKLSEANIERLRDMRERLSSLDQSLNELISKAASAQGELSETTNQTRTRILG